MKLQIKEFAELTGVSVRTLHYYDEIGLLKPSFVDEQNGYRFYNEASLERMQEILFYRELDFPLKSIAEILASPNYDKQKALAEQKRLLMLKKERLAQMPAVEQTPEETAKSPVNAPCAPTEPYPEPVPRKIRKSGTGCLYQINDSLWEGSFFPRLPSGKRKKFNIYAETKELCEIKLAEMIKRVKAEIAEEKAKLKGGAE